MNFTNQLPSDLYFIFEMFNIFLVEISNRKILIFLSEALLEHLLELVVCKLRGAAAGRDELDYPDDEPGEGDHHVLIHLPGVTCPKVFRLHELEEKFEEIFLGLSADGDAGHEQGVHGLHLGWVESDQPVDAVVVQTGQSRAEELSEMFGNISVLLHDIGPAAHCLLLQEEVLEGYRGTNCTEEGTVLSKGLINLAVAGPQRFLNSI